MRSLRYVAITTTLASAIIFAQSQTTPATQNAPAQAASTATPMTGYARTFNGTIVNAECSQASILASSGSYADRATSSGSAETAANAASSNKDNKSVYDKQREVLKHCRANDKSTAFAVLTDDGSFYKLDDAGNSQVTSAAGADKEKKKNLKNMRVTVTGTPQGDSLKVQSLSKTDKPFGSD